MWKKDEGQPGKPTTASAPSGAPSRTNAAGSARATIGPSISIRGDVTGSEDLLIQGQVDGSVTLELHEVTVGGEGRVKAGITGRVIAVEGSVEGDLIAQEQIVLRATAHVLGDLRTPRLVLEDGATFRGLVDMSAAQKNDEAANSASEAAIAIKGGKAPTTRKAMADTPKRAAI